MERNDNRELALLLEIRDLLQIVADASWPAYVTAVNKRMGARAETLRGIATSAERWTALELMDSTRAQSKIASAAGMDSGNLSRYVAQLRKAEFVEERESGADRLPKAMISRNEIRALREVGSG